MASLEEGSRARLTELVRAGEWWEYKLVPIFAAFYATAMSIDVGVGTLWKAAITTLLALVPGAAYVSVINDLADRADDLAASKWNRSVGRSPLTLTALIALPVSCGVAFAYAWRHDRLLVTFYLAAWLAFSLYSLPPFRFKARGILGVLCDASGAHLFPTLVAVVLAARGAGVVPRTDHLLVMGGWALAHGMRGILWHQLTDLEHDRSAGVRTFAQRSPQAAAFLGTWIAFPIEVTTLAAILVRIGGTLPVAILGLYLVTVVLRVRWWRMHAVIVAPRPRFLIVLQEYYSSYFAVSILLAMQEWLVLAIHLMFFPVGPLRAARDAWRLASQRDHPR